jgi:hypothetical protein
MNRLGSLAVNALLAALCWTNAFSAEPGHPRVLVDKADVEKLRARCRQEPYTSMLRCIEKQLNRPAEETKSIMYDNRPLNLASVYLLTGEAKYAREGGAGRHRRRRGNGRSVQGRRPGSAGGRRQGHVRPVATPPQHRGTEDTENGGTWSVVCCLLFVARGATEEGVRNQSDRSDQRDFRDDGHLTMGH